MFFQLSQVKISCSNIRHLSGNNFRTPTWSRCTVGIFNAIFFIFSILFTAKYGKLSFWSAWTHFVQRSATLHYTVNHRPHWACRQYGQPAIGEQQWVTVSLCVWSVVGWLIVYQFGTLSLSCSQHSQTICLSGWDDNACLGVRSTE